MKLPVIYQACICLLVLTTGAGINAQTTTGTESWRQPDQNSLAVLKGNKPLGPVYSDLLTSDTEHVYMPGHAWVRRTVGILPGQIDTSSTVYVPAGINEITTQTYRLRNGNNQAHVYQISPNNFIRSLGGW